MPPENPRITALRRRVQADPASTAFAQLAEEYRRAGNFSEAVRYCRAGLTRHAGYASARVTLGRSLLALGELDEATAEIERALRGAPDNPAAVRAMADIHQQRGQLPSALAYYKRALALTPVRAELDELEKMVARITRELDEDTPPAPDRAAGTSAAPVSRQPLTDFDSLLAALGAPHAAPPPSVEHLLSGSKVAPVDARSVPLVQGTPDPHDPFARLEADLPVFEPAPLTAYENSAMTTALRGRAATPVDRASEMIIEELEAWLRVIVAERAAASGA